MKPYIVDFSWLGYTIRVPSYGFMLALAFSAGYFEALRRCLREKENPRHIEYLFLILIASTVIGSRLFHVIFEDPIYYFNHPVEIFSIWKGGYTFYGGLLIGILGVYVYARVSRVNFLHFGDILAPSVLLGLSLGRIGCFLAGCCWGRPTDRAWGVVFSNPLSFASDHVRAVHPTQLYEAGAALVLFALCWRLFQKRRFDGQIFFTGLIGYSLARFVIEFFRGDDYRGFVLEGTLSYAQLVSLTVLPFTVVALFLFSRLQREHEA